MEFPIRKFASWRLPLQALQSRRRIERDQVDLVHSFDYPTAIFFAPILFPRKRTAVITSLRSYRSLIPEPYRTMLRQAERTSDMIVVNSSAVRDDLTANEGIPASRLRLVYNAVDTSEFSPPASLSPRPRPAALAGADLVVGCICGIREEKDLPTLMRAVAALRRGLPGLRLVLVGSGPAEPEIESLRRELAIEDITVLVPQTSTTQFWLEAIDIFVLPSVSEALSNALLEAMSSECAVVASRVGGNPEIVQSGVNGLLFPPTDVVALTEAIRSLAENPAWRLALARAGRESVERRFSPSAAAEQLATLYRELL